MKTHWVKKILRGLLLATLIGAGASLVGCADEYAGYPGYHGGYYARASTYPYYGGYGYPYRAYGPYYGSGYYGYGAPYYGYGGPYYGGASVVVSSNNVYGYRNGYAYRNGYTYRDRYGRVITRRTNHPNRVRTARTRTTRTQSGTQVPPYQNDDERRYYSRP
jgi:hypothetical protein